jgi:Do/DeqQ family serine protease
MPTPWFALSLLVIALSAGPCLAQTQRAAPTSRADVTLSFAPVAKAAAPAVVNVFTRKVVRTQAVSPLLNDPFFRQFFGDRLGAGIPQERIQRSLGSGVIVREDGLIVSNYHVIKDSDEITIVLSDRREFEATLLGSDERTDIAVLKIDVPGNNLPVLPMGDSDSLEVGDLVLAIGNPFGVGQTVTSGIVSALARTNVGVSDFQSFIQTDAAINPGNSGGALVDMNGRLIGINTAIFSRGGGSNGIGFAIPTSMVQAVMNSLSRGGKVVRPWLGASGQSVTGELATQVGLTLPRGVLLDGVYPGGPADKAGLRLGDVVIAVNGREVNDPQGLRFRLATLPLGTEAKVTILRRGREEVLSMGLVAPPEVPARNESEIGGRNPFSGAVVANLNPALADELGVNTVERGVIVLRIRRGTIAHRLQIQPGDQVLKVNDKATVNVADLSRALDARTERWSIQIKRNGEVMSLVIGG